MRAAYGWQDQEGLLTYTADGRMMSITTKGGRKPLSVPDNVGAPAEERAEAFATMTAYAGSYREGTLLCLRLTGDEGIKAFIRAEFQVPSK